MKKILALVLALAMMLCMGTAFADEAALIETSKPATYEAITKNYTVTGADTQGIYPAETLTFTSTPAESNPDTTNLTVNALTINAQSKKLVVNLPEFTKVGVYNFTIAETAGTTQGVTYTDATIAVSVLVTYDYDDADQDGYGLTATFGLTNVEGGKVDTLTNEYDLGSLAVSKKVTGNVGDKNKEFEVTVTFASEANKTVKSTITYTDGDKTETIPGDWTGSKEVTITLKHGETVEFIDIPAGVTYTVVEGDYTDGDVNGANGYDAPEYEFSDETKTIAQSDADTVEITNNKTATVETGINMDSMPYIVLMGLVVLAGVALILKKRTVND